MCGVYGAGDMDGLVNVASMRGVAGGRELKMEFKKECEKECEKEFKVFTGANSCLNPPRIALAHTPP